MTFSAGMMQTAPNEAGAIEEEAEGTGGLCVRLPVCAEHLHVCVRAGLAPKASGSSGAEYLT